MMGALGALHWPPRSRQAGSKCTSASSSACNGVAARSACCGLHHPPWLTSANFCAAAFFSSSLPCNATGHLRTHESAGCRREATRSHADGRWSQRCCGQLRPCPAWCPAVCGRRHTCATHLHFVGVHLQRELAVGPLDLRLVGGPRHLQQLIVVAPAQGGTEGRTCLFIQSTSCVRGTWRDGGGAGGKAGGSSGGSSAGSRCGQGEQAQQQDCRQRPSLPHAELAAACWEGTGRLAGSGGRWSIVRALIRVETATMAVFPHLGRELGARARGQSGSAAGSPAGLPAGLIVQCTACASAVAHDRRLQCREALCMGALPLPRPCACPAHSSLPLADCQHPLRRAQGLTASTCNNLLTNPRQQPSHAV